MADDIASIDDVDYFFARHFDSGEQIVMWVANSRANMFLTTQIIDPQILLTTDQLEALEGAEITVENIVASVPGVDGQAPINRLAIKEITIKRDDGASLAWRAPFDSEFPWGGAAIEFDLNTDVVRVRQALEAIKPIVSPSIEEFIPVAEDTLSTAIAEWGPSLVLTN